MVGQSYDGDASVSGHFKGVKTVIKENHLIAL